MIGEHGGIDNFTVDSERAWEWRRDRLFTSFKSRETVARWWWEIRRIFIPRRFGTNKVNLISVSADCNRCRFR